MNDAEHNAIVRECAAKVAAQIGKIHRACRPDQMATGTTAHYALSNLAAALRAINDLTKKDSAHGAN